MKNLLYLLIDTLAVFMALLIGVAILILTTVILGAFLVGVCA